MEQDRLLKLTEERFMEFSDKVQSMVSHAEDLLFRAQRWSNAIKNHTGHKDTLFADDTQLLRRHVRSFIQDASALPGLIEWLDRECHYDADSRALDKARSLLKVTSQFEKDLAGLNEQLRHLHHFTPETDLKVEVWYMVQDVEVLHDKCKGYPFFVSSRVMSRISTPEKGTQVSGPAA
ncbi:MAG: hypothetical protein HY924_02610 [Elusimicrobia bacterium]|nr:hypothetical protein [Elusimicrobiota bacterium]